MDEKHLNTRNERGAVMLWAAFFLMVMLGFVSLGIDVAKLATARTQLQNAADAAALAGASAIDSETGVLIPDSALARAQYTAAQNVAFVNEPRPVQLLASDVRFPSASEIRVTVRRDPTAGGSVVTHVARVIGIDALDVRASASARVQPSGAVLCGLVPLWASPPDGETTFQTGCGGGYALKVGAKDGSQGNYGGLTFPRCEGGPCASMAPRGASTFRCLLENGYCCEVAASDQLFTEPGNMSGPVAKGVQTRFSRDTDSREGICYSQYNGNGERVVMVPVTTRPGSGRTTVSVTGFAAFFLKNIPGTGNESRLEGEFLYDIVPGSGVEAAPNTGTLFSVRLVE